MCMFRCNDYVCKHCMYWHFYTSTCIYICIRSSPYASTDFGGVNVTTLKLTKITDTSEVASGTGVVEDPITIAVNY